MPGPNEITPAALMRRIGLPDAPVVLDVRIEEDVAADPRTIPTARRMSHDAVFTASSEFAGKEVVVVCQRGLKLSQGVAALLRSRGILTESVEGGTLAWAEANLPLTPIDRLPTTRFWVTRHRPKIDRIACPWLIRRFVDPLAEFLFVAPSQVLAVAERFNAIPFDIEGAAYSHAGDFCTFDTLLDRLGLRTEALERLGLVIRGADTDRHDLHPAAAGLLAISVGLSRQYKSDAAQLAAGMAIYDALYRWARDGHEEGHDWPAERRK